MKATWLLIVFIFSSVKWEQDSSIYFLKLSANKIIPYQK